MKKRLLWVVGAFTVSTWAACNCGHGPGQACTVTSECATGQSCVNGYCSLDDGGPGPGGDGGPGSDGGNPDGGDGGCVNLECQQVSCADGGTTTLTGTVYDPSGQVPLYNAMVYVPNGQTQPFTPGVTCDRCGAVTSGSPLVITLTGADGTFSLQNVPTGNNIPLVIQIGRWRRQVTIPSVPSCASTPITDVNLVRMPRNKSEGDIPQMAIASGSADPFECLLRKMGISDSEFTLPSGNGRIHYYVANGINMSPPAPADSTLWTDGGTLKNYDIVLLPCEGGEHLKPSYATQNIIDYTSAGGRLFTTHYGYVWIYGNAGNPVQPPFPSTGTWVPQSCDSYSTPLPVTVDQTFPKGASFAQWLVNVGASTAAGTLTLIESRHDLFQTDGGAQQWLFTNIGSCSGNPPAVEHMTFNTPLNPPNQADGGAGLQCGRVVYSDFHVSASALADGGGTFPTSCKVTALTPQEKALVFMLFDVSSCIQADSAPPTVCAGVRQTCSAANPCCNGLVCKASSGAVCSSTDTGCRCGALLN